MSSCCNASLLWTDFIGTSYKRSSGIRPWLVKPGNICLRCLTLSPQILKKEKEKEKEWTITEICYFRFWDNVHLIFVCFNRKAREFLYFKMYGKQCITPVAIMTSSAKKNHEHVTSLCERLGWFGRGRSSFKFFEQVLWLKLWGFLPLFAFLMVYAIWVMNTFFHSNLLCELSASCSIN